MKVTGSVLTSILVIFENSQVHIQYVIASCIHVCISVTRMQICAGSRKGKKKILKHWETLYSEYNLGAVLG